MRLLDGLAKPACGKVDFTSEPLRLVIAEPVLQKRSTDCQMSPSARSLSDLLQRGRTQRVESEALTSMGDSQLAC